MSAPPQNRLRSLCALLCLVAVVLLYAPLGGAAWSLYSTACCASRQCPIKGQHAQHALPAPGEHPMDCDHNMPAMAQCSMSCCHNPDKPALAPVIFVLPAPFKVYAAANMERFVPSCDARSSVISAEPLSPPPRISPLAA